MSGRAGMSTKDVRTMADEVHEQPDEQEPEEEHESVSELLDRLGRDTRALLVAELTYSASEHTPQLRGRPRPGRHAAGRPRIPCRVRARERGRGQRPADVASGWRAPLLLAAVWVVVGLLLALALGVRASRLLGVTCRRRETARRLSRHGTRPRLRCATRSNASQARWRARPRSGSRRPWCPSRAASSTPVRTCWRRPASELEDLVEQVPEGRAAGQMIDLVLLPGRIGIRVATAVLQRPS